jgi:hypothetical protein
LHYGDFYHGNPTIHLHNLDTNRDFVVKVGFDSNVDGDIDDSGEVLRSINVHVFDVTFQYTFSDQFADIDANFLPDRNGDGSRNGVPYDYLMMGTRSDGQAHVRAVFETSHEAVRSKLLFYIPPLSGSWTKPTTSSVTGAIVRVSTQLFGEAGVQDRKIVAGIDYDGDGLLSNYEVVARDPHLLRIVNGTTYSQAFDTLSILRNTWTGLQWDFAANFLYSFQYDLPLEGATSTTFILDPSEEKSYTHNTGAIFNSGATATIRLNTFGNDSLLARRVADSTEMTNRVKAALKAHESEIRAAIPNPDPPSPIEFDWLLLAAGSDNFAFSNHPDLKFSVGGHTIRDLRAKVRLDYTVVEPGQPARYTIVSARLAGTILDLYDFDYEAPGEATQGAIVQAGYGTLGTGGHVFRNRIDLDTVAQSLTLANVEQIWTA